MELTSGLGGRLTRWRTAARTGFSRFRGLPDEELFGHYRDLLFNGGPRAESNRYWAELAARLRPRLYRFFLHLANSDPRCKAPEALASELTSKALRWIRSDPPAVGSRYPGRAVDGTMRIRLQTVSPEGRKAADAIVFRTAHRIWTDHWSDLRRAVNRLGLEFEEIPMDPGVTQKFRACGSDWQALWEQLDRLRAAEAECLQALCGMRPSPRAHPHSNFWIAELWVRCSAKVAAGSRTPATAIYAEMGVAGRSTSRDLKAAIRFMRTCMVNKGIEPVLVHTLCSQVESRAK